MNHQTDRLYRDTKNGTIELLIDRSSGNLQINCVMPPSGPGFFVVFHEGYGTAKAVQAAVDLSERSDLPESANITATIPGALAAGTVPRPRFQFGTPEVSRGIAA